MMEFQVVSYYQPYQLVQGLPGQSHSHLVALDQTLKPTNPHKYINTSLVTVQIHLMQLTIQ